MMKYFVFFHILISIFCLGCNPITTKESERTSKDKIDSNKNNIFHKKYDIAYMTLVNDSIGYWSWHTCVSNLDLNDEICFNGNIWDPLITPDGTKLIAYYKKSKESRSKKILIDLTTLQYRDIDLGYRCCYQIIPSPDTINAAVISAVRDSSGVCLDSKIDIINATHIEKSHLNIIKSASLSTPTWSSDGDYLVTNNSDKIFLYNFVKNSCDTIDATKLFGDTCQIYRSSRIWLSSDHSFLVFNAYSQDKMIKGEWYPNCAIFIYDLFTKKLTRLTPEEITAAETVLVNDNELFFVGFTGIQKTDLCIYKLTINDKKIVKFLEEAQSISFRTKD